MYKQTLKQIKGITVIITSCLKSWTQLCASRLDLHKQNIKHGSLKKKLEKYIDFYNIIQHTKHL